MAPEPVLVARCSVHGFAGDSARGNCGVCGGPVEQVPMVPLAEQLTGDEIEGLLWALRVGHIKVDEGFAFPRDSNREILRSAREKLEAMRDV